MSLQFEFDIETQNLSEFQIQKKSKMSVSDDGGDVMKTSFSDSESGDVDDPFAELSDESDVGKLKLNTKKSDGNADGKNDAGTRASKMSTGTKNTAAVVEQRMKKDGPTDDEVWEKKIKSKWGIKEHVAIPAWLLDNMLEICRLDMPQKEVLEEVEKKWGHEMAKITRDRLAELHEALEKPGQKYTSIIKMLEEIAEMYSISFSLA